MNSQWIWAGIIGALVIFSVVLLVVHGRGKRKLMVEISEVWNEVKENRDSIVRLYLEFRDITNRVGGKANILCGEIQTLYGTTTDAFDELYEPLNERLGGFWLWWVNFWYQEDKVSDRFLRISQFSIKGLKKLLAITKALAQEQKELIAKLEYATTPNQLWGGRMITPIELPVLIEEREKSKKAEDVELARRQRRLVGAEKAFRYALAYLVRKERSHRALSMSKNIPGLLELSESPVGDGSRFLRLGLIRPYIVWCRSQIVLAKEQGDDPEVIAEFIEKASADIQHGFIKKASDIAKLEAKLDSTRDRFVQFLNDSLIEGAVPSEPDALLEVSEILSLHVPTLWADVHKWDELELVLEEVGAQLESAAKDLGELINWQGVILALQKRVAENQEKETTLTDGYLVSLPEDPRWDSALALLGSEVPALWAGYNWAHLIEITSEIDEAMSKREQRVNQRLEMEGNKLLSKGGRPRRIGNEPATVSPVSSDEPDGHRQSESLRGILWRPDPDHIEAWVKMAHPTTQVPIEVSESRVEEFERQGYRKVN